MHKKNTLLVKSSRFLKKAKFNACFLVLAASTVSEANTTSSEIINTEDIRQEIVYFIESQIPTNSNDLEITPYKISKALKLPTCQHPVELNREGGKPDFYGRNTIKVSCFQPKWSFYSGATVKAYGEVIIAASPIAKGEIIAASHISYRRIDLSRASGNTLTSPETIIGKAAKRPIRQGKQLSSHFFEEPMLIKRGNAVTIQAVGKSMTISTSGEALSNGRRGQNIRVRNIKSNREIIGTVKDKNTVTVMLH